MQMPLEKKPSPSPLGSLVRGFMDDLSEGLGLSCVALGPGCRDLEDDLFLQHSRIDEVDFFGVGPVVDSGRLADAADRLPGDFQGRRLRVAAVNGPYRTPYPKAATLVFHITIWPEKWLTRVCPFVVNGFRRSRVFVGADPGSTVPERRPEPRQLLKWHYGLENGLRYIRAQRFEAPTWWIDGRPCDGKMVPHDISGTYQMTEFVAYTLNAALCNAENFPAVTLPAAADQARSMAAEFRRRALDARNGIPVDAAWLASRKPAAEALIEQLIRELEEVL
ncbi:MAG: hypothetical protein PVG78_06030 [Desulfobacterales bacterium]|jgi:hypothetical protein